MYRTVKFILIGLLFVSVYFGSNQMGTHNDVFASAMLHCCNNGQCHDFNCSVGSSILPCSGSEYSSTCLGCMNVVAGLRDCGKYAYYDLWPTWCNLSDGTKYYGRNLEEL